MHLTIELDREDDGRWIAEVVELPGVMTYGATREEAVSNSERLAIDVIADRIKHGELPSGDAGIAFVPTHRFCYECVEHPDPASEGLAAQWSAELVNLLGLRTRPTLQWIELAQELTEIGEKYSGRTHESEVVRYNYRVRGYAESNDSNRVLICHEFPLREVLRTIAHEFMHLHQDRCRGSAWRTANEELAEREAEEFANSLTIVGRAEELVAAHEAVPN